MNADPKEIQRLLSGIMRCLTKLDDIPLYIEE